MRFSQFNRQLIFTFRQIISRITVPVKEQRRTIIDRVYNFIISSRKIEISHADWSRFTRLRIASNGFYGSFCIPYKRCLIFCRLGSRFRSIRRIINIGTFTFCSDAYFVFGITHNIGLFQQRRGQESLHIIDTQRTFRFCKTYTEGIRRSCFKTNDTFIPDRRKRIGSFNRHPFSVFLYFQRKSTNTLPQRDIFLYQHTVQRSSGR